MTNGTRRRCPLSQSLQAAARALRWTTTRVERTIAVRLWTAWTFHASLLAADLVSA